MPTSSIWPRWASRAASRCPTPRASAPPSWPTSRPASAAPPTRRWRWSWRSSTSWSPRRWRCRPPSPRPAGRSRRSTSRRRWPSWPRASNYVRPVLSEEPAFTIEGGRHPVVEAALLRQGGAGFVPNDCDLGRERRLWLLTGPNMAGKSTFLRQNALIAVMAQAGSFVPAKAADHRHRRPPVQPRRRGRRSGARPLDLHGRDGRDGGDPQPGDGAEAS